MLMLYSSRLDVWWQPYLAQGPPANLRVTERFLVKTTKSKLYWWNRASLIDDEWAFFNLFRGFDRSPPRLWAMFTKFHREGICWSFAVLVFTIMFWLYRNNFVVLVFSLDTLWRQSENIWKSITIMINRFSPTSEKQVSSGKKETISPCCIVANGNCNLINITYSFNRPKHWLLSIKNLVTSTLHQVTNKI